MLDDLRSSTSLVFSSPGYVMLAAGLGALLLLFYLAVPLMMIPGASIRSIIAMMSFPEQVSTVLLSALMGALGAMQAYAWRNNAHRISHAGAGLAGFLSGSLSIFLTTASCASCMSALFSFIGFGGVMFFYQHKGEVTALTFLILGASLYLTSRRIAGKCASCSIPDAAGQRKGGKEEKAAE